MTVFSLKDLPPALVDRAGGKGRTLARLLRAGYAVPDGFVILPDAFDGDDLKPEAWEQVQTHLNDLRQHSAAFAVRSSALGEDSAAASFAGEFETVLGVQSDGDVRAAIRAVRRSRHSERVQVYSREHGLDGEPEMAVVVQQLVRADLSGVLFTADPITGSQVQMTGNFVHGLGEQLVSGAVNPAAFTIRRPRGHYNGPTDLNPYARRFYRLARRLVGDLGGPQDIEWAIAGGRLYLLQARPMTTLRAYNPATGEWNSSLTGDYLWANGNMAEAMPDVMTPATWSMMQLWLEATQLFDEPPEYACPGSGNIGGRLYSNLTPLVSAGRKLGIRPDKMLQQLESLWGKVPTGLDLTLLPYPLRFVYGTFLPAFLKGAWTNTRRQRQVPAFAGESPRWCAEMLQRIRAIGEPAGLIALWQDAIASRFRRACQLVTACVSLKQAQLEQQLARLVGVADANALLSSLSGTGTLDSLGPLVGLTRVARGGLSREDYMTRFGHRCASELELSVPRPAEDPTWFDHQLGELARSPSDVDTLLANQRSQSAAAWGRFQDQYPRKAKSFRRKIDQVSQVAQWREMARSEHTRIVSVIRAWVLRAGELTGLGGDVFFLTLDEMRAVLAGETAATAHIPPRKAAQARCQALPRYPAVINGRFDPAAWAVDPRRRSDLFDAHAPAAPPPAGVVMGFPGSPGVVEGIVRRLDSADESDRFQAGEILVTSITNIGWTLIFPRAAAIVTDVGAPLSHAAIVARELGIPAVVGCGNATARLHTGDRVRVDGREGTVEMLAGAP